jgi:hypothetical protein
MAFPREEHAAAFLVEAPSRLDPPCTTKCIGRVVIGSLRYGLLTIDIE